MLRILPVGFLSSERFLFLVPAILQAFRECTPNADELIIVRELDSALFQHRFIGDRVTTIDRFGAVANHRHRGGARHACTFDARQCTESPAIVPAQSWS